MFAARNTIVDILLFVHLLELPLRELSENVVSCEHVLARARNCRWLKDPGVGFTIDEKVNAESAGFEFPSQLRAYFSRYATAPRQ